MTGSEHSALEQAVDWAKRVDSPAFDQWEELEAWLAQDPINAVVFDSVCNDVDNAAQALMAERTMPLLRLVEAMPTECHPVGPVLAKDAGQNASRRSPWIPASIAAAVAGLIAYGLVPGREKPAEHELVISRPGQVRTVSLAAGGVVTLNGGSSARIAEDGTEVELVNGQAAFEIRHDPSRVFIVRVGEAVVTDLGTTFDIERTPDGSLIAVANGAVDVKAGGRSVRLIQGQQSRVIDGKGPLAASPIPIETIATWRSGRLVYTDATIAQVAADVSRRSGVRIGASPLVASRRFAGIIDTRGAPAVLISRIEDVLDVDAVDNGGGWVLNARKNGGFGR